MPIPTRTERPYRVRFDEAGPDGYLRSSGYLRYAQDFAWIHSESAGFGREWYDERKLTWLVRAVELDVLEEVPYGFELIVSTEVIGFRRVWARRRTEFHRAGSEGPAAVAITDWVLLNGRGVPTRVPAEIVGVFGEPAADFSPMRLQLVAAPETADAEVRTVRRSELDPMGHVNNAAYFDYLDEHLLTEGPSRRTSLPVPRRYRAEFIASAEPQIALVGRGWDDGVAWAYRLEDDRGREMLRARVEADRASWIGG